MLSRIFKKLDILIIKAFIGPFIATFFVTLFVLVLQFFWLYIDDVVGKGVDLFTVARLILYVSATLVPLALPLAVLLSSIMTLGNLGETFELVAIKSAGISLLRFIRPLFFLSLALTITAFLFNNNILPIANLKMNTLKYDIIVSKPAFDIKEGVFYDKIEGYVIKIGKKENDDSTIRNVVIYEQNNNGPQDNIIVAEKGKMIVTPDKRSLLFILQNGWTYQEKGERNSLGTEFVRMGFQEYKKVLDLSSFKLNKTDDSTFKHNHQMLTLKVLSHNIDSLDRRVTDYRQQANNILRNNMKFLAYMDTTGWEPIEKTPAPSRFLQPEARVRDSLVKGWTAARKKQDSLDKAQAAAKAQTTAKAKADTHANNTAANTNHPGATPTTPANPGTPATGNPGATATNTPAGNAPVVAANPDATAKTLSKTPPDVTFADLLPDSARSAVLDHAISVVNSTKVGLDQPALLFENEEHNIREHEIAWHEKLTLAVACLVMFLIGAPLGSIIRKGGIGLPLVFAVVLFVVFFLLNNFGKKFVSQAVLSPVAGMWMATYVLTPLGLFLTYKALHDSQLFNKEFYFRLSAKFRTLLARFRKEKPASRKAEPQVQ